MVDSSINERKMSDETNADALHIFYPSGLSLMTNNSIN